MKKVARKALDGWHLKENNSLCLNLKNVLFVLMTLVVANSCDDRQIGEQPKKVAEKKTDSMVSKTIARTKNELVFKNWLTDTLRELKKTSIDETSKYRPDSITFEVRKDSLGLSISHFYNVDLVIAKNTKWGGESPVMVVMSMLKEYKEVPKNRFAVKFTFYNFYSPRMAEELTYDRLVEYNDIEVYESGFLTVYSYIRGRLSSKEVYSQKDNHLIKIKHIDFNWEGNRIIKRELDLKSN